eukprot:2355290-Prymnesium_polylepis.1
MVTLQRSARTWLLCLLVFLSGTAHARLRPGVTAPPSAAVRARCIMAYRPRKQTESTPKTAYATRPDELELPTTDAPDEDAPDALGLETPQQRVHEIGLARLHGRRRWYRELRSTGISPAVRLGLRLPPLPPPWTPRTERPPWTAQPPLPGSEA